jgi:hypothetical protein
MEWRENEDMLQACILYTGVKNNTKWNYLSENIAKFTRQNAVQYTLSIQNN